jgi:phage terminase large subunit-like protein
MVSIRNDLVVNDKPKPCSRRQYLYTASECDVTLYGGAAGSGKSEIAVIDFCQYVRYPNFIGVISRRTTPMLKGAGGILTKCKRTFAKEFKDDPDYTYQWKEKDGKFCFYKKIMGADGKVKLNQISELYLKHSEHEALIEEYWQSIEANMIVLDESTQYTLPMVSYIFSRMRNPSCPEVKPRIKLTCNPMHNHFLRKWVEPYLLPDGTPDRSKDGLIRYFQMHNGGFYFADTPEDVVAYVGCELRDVLTFTFVSATVADNRILQEIDPRYVSWLKGLKGTDRKRLLEGNWYAKEEGISYFTRSNMIEIDVPPDYSEFTKIVRSYDLAGSLPSEVNPNCDYTASVKMGKLRSSGEYVILEVLRHRIRWGEWKKHILENAERDGAMVDIIIPQDPGIQAKANSYTLAKEIIESGFSCTTKRSVQGKLEDFKPFAACVQLSAVKIVKGCCTDLWHKIYNDNDFYYEELENFTGIRSNRKDGHDDMVDATSSSFNYIAQSSTQLPSGFLSGMKSFDTSNKSPLLNIK